MLWPTEASGRLDWPGSQWCEAAAGLIAPRRSRSVFAIRVHSRVEPIPTRVCGSVWPSPFTSGLRVSSFNSAVSKATVMAASGEGIFQTNQFLDYLVQIGLDVHGFQVCPGFGRVSKDERKGGVDFQAGLSEEKLRRYEYALRTCCRGSRPA